MNISFLLLWILTSVSFASTIDDIKAQNENEASTLSDRVTIGQ